MSESLGLELPVYELSGSGEDSLSASLPSQDFDLSTDQLSHSMPEPSVFDHAETKETGPTFHGRRKFQFKRKFAHLDGRGVEREAEPLNTKRSRIVETHSVDVPPSTPAKKPAKKSTAKPKPQGKVKPSYGEFSKRITEFSGPLPTTNKNVALENEQGKWPYTFLLRRGVLDRFLKECVGLDITKPLPLEIRIKSAQRIAWLEDRSKFGLEDFLLGVPMRSIKPDHFRDLYVMALHLLTPTYAHPPRQTYKITFEEVRELGRFTCELLQLPTKALKQPAFAHWSSEQLWFAIEPHPVHKCAATHCARITWIWGEQAIVFDTCRRLACFFPPLSFGQECPLIALTRLVAKPDDFRLSRAQEALEDKLRDIIKKGKDRKFRPCAGVDGVHHTSGLLSTLYLQEL